MAVTSPTPSASFMAPPTSPGLRSASNAASTAQQALEEKREALLQHKKARELAKGKARSQMSLSPQQMDAGSLKGRGWGSVGRRSGQASPGSTIMSRTASSPEAATLGLDPYSFAWSDPTPYDTALAYSANPRVAARGRAGASQDSGRFWVGPSSSTLSLPSLDRQSRSAPTTPGTSPHASFLQPPNPRSRPASPAPSITSAAWDPDREAESVRRAKQERRRTLLTEQMAALELKAALTEHAEQGKRSSIFGRSRAGSVSSSASSIVAAKPQGSVVQPSPLRSASTPALGSYPNPASRHSQPHEEAAQVQPAREAKAAFELLKAERLSEEMRKHAEGKKAKSVLKEEEKRRKKEESEKRKTMARMTRGNRKSWFAAWGGSSTGSVSGKKSIEFDRDREASCDLPLPFKADMKAPPTPALPNQFSQPASTPLPPQQEQDPLPPSPPEPMGLAFGSHTFPRRSSARNTDARFRLETVPGSPVSVPITTDGSKNPLPDSSPEGLQLSLPQSTLSMSKPLNDSERKRSVSQASEHTKSSNQNETPGDSSSIDARHHTLTPRPCTDEELNVPLPLNLPPSKATSIPKPAPVNNNDKVKSPMLSVSLWGGETTISATVPQSKNGSKRPIRNSSLAKVNETPPASPVLANSQFGLTPPLTPSSPMLSVSPVPRSPHSNVSTPTLEAENPLASENGSAASSPSAISSLPLPSPSRPIRDLSRESFMVDPAPQPSSVPAQGKDVKVVGNFNSVAGELVGHAQANNIAAATQPLPPRGVSLMRRVIGTQSSSSSPPVNSSVRESVSSDGSGSNILRKSKSTFSLLFATNGIKQQERRDSGSSAAESSLDSYTVQDSPSRDAKKNRRRTTFMPFGNKGKILNLEPLPSELPSPPTFTTNVETSKESGGNGLFNTMRKSSRSRSATLNGLVSAPPLNGKPSFQTGDDAPASPRLPDGFDYVRRASPAKSVSNEQGRQSSNAARVANSQVTPVSVPLAQSMSNGATSISSNASFFSLVTNDATPRDSASSGTLAATSGVDWANSNPPLPSPSYPFPRSSSPSSSTLTPRGRLSFLKSPPPNQAPVPPPKPQAQPEDSSMRMIPQTLAPASLPVVKSDSSRSLPTPPSHSPLHAPAMSISASANSATTSFMTSPFYQIASRLRANSVKNASPPEESALLADTTPSNASDVDLTPLPRQQRTASIAPRKIPSPTKPAWDPKDTTLNVAHINGNLNGASSDVVEIVAAARLKRRDSGQSIASFRSVRSTKSTRSFKNGKNGIGNGGAVSGVMVKSTSGKGWGEVSLPPGLA